MAELLSGPLLTTFQWPMGFRKDPGVPTNAAATLGVNDSLTAMHKHSVATLCSNFRQIANPLLPFAFTLQDGGR